MEVAGAEKNLEAAAEVKGFDAVLIEFERLVVDGADEVAAGGNALIEDRTNRRKFLGLGEHERGELFAGKFARTIEESAIEIIVEGEMSRVEGRERKLVAVLEIFPIEMKGFAGLFAGTAIPAIGENDSTDIPRESSYASHEQSPDRR